MMFTANFPYIEQFKTKGILIWVINYTNNMCARKSQASYTAVLFVWISRINKMNVSMSYVFYLFKKCMQANFKI